MIHRRISTGYKLVLMLSSFAFLVLGYSWLSYRQHLANPSDTTLPNIAQFVHGLEMMTEVNKNGEMWLRDDFVATYARYAAGFFIGTFIAYIIGVAMGCFTEADAFLSKLLNGFCKIPPTAMMAVYFVVFGVGMKMYIAVVSLGIMPILAQAISQSIRKDIGKNAINKARTLGADTPEVVWDVCVKNTLPRAIEAIRLQLGPALIFLVAAEMVVADVGVGYRLRIHYRMVNMNVIYLYLAFLGAVGAMMDIVMLQLRKRFCPWFGE